jgi:hypothetical protein
MESRVCDQIAKVIGLVKVTAKQKIGDINSDPIPPIG